MKSSAQTKADLINSFFNVIYSDSDNDVACIMPNNFTFKSPQHVINFNMELYDAFHGVNDWHYNLLTGRLEKKN
jgi:hypothetical protein